jgi:hypothetical protein
MQSAMALGLQKSPEGQIYLFGLPVGIEPTLSLPHRRAAPPERGAFGVAAALTQATSKT